jgi:hypothetical protein
MILPYIFDRSYDDSNWRKILTMAAWHLESMQTCLESRYKISILWEVIHQEHHFTLL